MIDTFLKHWIWYSIAIFFICKAIYDWYKATNDRDKYLAEANRLEKSLENHVNWMRRYDEVVMENDYGSALQMLRYSNIDSQLRDALARKLSKDGEKITFESTRDWEKAFETSNEIAVEFPSNDIPRILKDNFAWWLAKEVERYPDAHFPFIIEKLGILTDHYVNSMDWDLAIKKIVLMGADRARNSNEVSELYEYVIKNHQRTEIFSILHKRALELSVNQQESGGIIVSC